MLVALDIHHAGKPSAPRDRGAHWDDVNEVDITRQYVEAAERRLVADGVDVVILSDGEYAARWVRANAYGVDAYVACHVNAGLDGRNGQRGEIYHWPGSKRGLPLATSIAERLGAACGWPTKPVAAATDRVRNTIRGVDAPAICFEPAFLDAGDHGARWLLANAAIIGTALALGILDWRSE